MFRSAVVVLAAAAVAACDMTLDPGGPCDPSTCRGCCRGGVCQPGSEAAACGLGGTACDDCAVQGRECVAGQCAGAPPAGADAGPTCVAKTCAQLGKDCGSVDDGCGKSLSCGTCSGGKTCSGGGVANVCGGCVSNGCAAQGKNCGYVPDGCGNTLYCGACSSGQTCGGGGAPNVCGCQPWTCSQLGKNCGYVSNGCGSTVWCGSCPSGQTCGGSGYANVCGCTPRTCSAQGYSCGYASDGCGGSIYCGSCASGYACSSGTCVQVSCSGNGCNAGYYQGGCCSSAPYCVNYYSQPTKCSATCGWASAHCQANSDCCSGSCKFNASAGWYICD